MKQRLLFPRQKVGLVWVGKPVRCSGQKNCSNWGAISRSQILLLDKLIKMLQRK